MSKIAVYNRYQDKGRRCEEFYEVVDQKRDPKNILAEINAHYGLRLGEKYLVLIKNDETK